MRAAGVEVRLLGPLEVATGTTLLDVGPPKQRSLFVLLALRAGQLVTVEDLIDGLWGQDPPRSAQKTLQTYVSGLRRAVPAAALATVPGGYRLELGPEQCDVARFENLLAAARRATADGDDTAASTGLHAALLLWRGQVLTDVVDQPYGAATAERLKELRRVAVEDLTDLRLRAGAHHELVADLQAQVSDEPLRERRWSQLMTALYRSGRQAEALQAFRTLRQLLDDELGIAPSAHLVRLEQEILQQRSELDWAEPEVRPVPDNPAQEPPQPAHPSQSRSPAIGLPAPTGTLVGRDDELVRLLTAVSTPGRPLTTLTGPGGSGKTRLAVEVAHRAASVFGGAVFFVPLAPVSTAEVMWTAISGALDLPPEGRSPPGLFDHLPARALVVLDNLEQLAGADTVVAQLMEHAPGIVVLATSRRPLHLRLEHEQPLPPLEVPRSDDLATAGRAGAVQLFLQQARMVSPGFDLGPDNTADVAAVCRRLDGLPLAIELAAARSRLLGPRALLRRLGESLDFRSRGADRPERHQTLRQTISWSHELLDPGQQAFFRRLAVFGGGAELDAVEAVAADVPGAAAVLDLVAGLVDASLVDVAQGADGEPRVTMLETIRAYAADELTAAGEREAVRERHAQHYLGLVDHLVAEINGLRHADAVARLEMDHDNIREALDWALGVAPDDDRRGPAPVAVGVRLCARLASFWDGQGYFAEGRTWLELAVERAAGAEDAALARCLQALASNLIITGDLEGAREAARSSVQMCRRVGSRGTLAMALAELGRIQSECGDLTGARPLYEEAIDVGADLSTMPTLMMDLAIIEAIEENYERSVQLNEEALRVATAAGQVLTSLMAEHNLACTLRLMGRVEEAEERMRGVTPRAVELYAADNLTALVEDFAAVVADLGHHDLAARMAGAADAVRRRSGAASAQTQQSEIAEPLERARLVLGPAAWDVAFRAGQELALPDVLAAACAVGR